MNSASSVNFDSILKKLEETSAFNKECTIGGFKFTMRVLSFSEEMKLTKIIDEISEKEDFTALNDWKKYVVSMSIYTMEGQRLPDILEVDNGESGIEKIERSLYLKEKLDNLPVKITEALFDVYSDLKEEAEKSLEEDLKYNWFKDPETRKKEEEKRIKEERSARDREISRLQNISNNSDPIDPEMGESLEESEDKGHYVPEDHYEDEIDLQKVPG